MTTRSDVGWLILVILALLAVAGLWRQLAYLRWVRSIRDPQKRMEAELLYRAWRKRRRKL